MSGRRNVGLLCMFLLVGTTYARKELLQDENGENSRKTESLRTPADVPVASSISHILRSLTRPSESEKPVHIITKTGVIETNRNGRGGKKLYYGEDLPSPVPSNVPAPVVVSSQTISINTAQGKNNTKRGRSISTVDADGVRTIEGVRVPDDEHDKFHTWRNARVIKNFLVENNRPANPHRKRQIVLSDARQLLSGQSGLYAQSLGPTQATLIDVSSLSQPKYQQAQAANVYYTQTAIPQTQTQVLQSLTSQQDLTSALYAAAAAQQQQQQQQQQVSAQQVYQYQSLANSPAASTIALTSPSGSGQEATYTYSAQQQPQQGQMYVLQPDGKTYLPYNPSTGQLVQSNPADQTRSQSLSHIQSQLSQSQFQSRSSEQIDKSASAESTHPQLQQHVLRLQQEQQAKIQQEQAYRQHILSKHRSHYQTETDQSGSAEKESPAVNIHSHSGQQAHAAVNPQQVYLNPSQLSRKSSREDLQQFVQIAETAIPTGANIRQQLQEQVSAQTQQILQPHKNSQQTHHHAQVYQIAHQTHQAQMQERPSSMAVHPVSQNQFIIQPQTYSAGGGQLFSVPVPIPINQIPSHGHAQHGQNKHAHSNHGQNTHGQSNHGQNNRGHSHHATRERERERDRDQNDKDEETNKNKNTLTNKLMESLHFNVNRRTAERFETSAVVPVLSSAGIILGLGALAAGWYLSKNNREVGIVKKSGKSEKGGGGKDSAVVAHLRRKRGTDEVDQASFFQSIIQHGIEKQQQTYEPPEHRYDSALPVKTPQPVYPAPFPPTNLIAQDRVQIKPLSMTRPAGPGSLGSKGSKADHNIVDKSGNGGSLSRVKNFANVAIPAVVLGGSVLVIAALIVGWYVSGANREIAFLEPSAYSRRKRSISSATTSLSDGWLHRILSSIHTNPYETEAAPSTKDVIVPHPFDPDTSKSTISDSDITNLTVALSLSAFAFGALTVLGLAWYFTDNSRQVAWAEKGPYSFGHWPTAYYGPRVRRSISTNDMTLDSMPENQGFLHKILDNLQVSQSSLLNKLHETGYSKWQETPCAQRIFCDVMSTQSDDTVRLMEKRMLNFLSMLPETVSSSLSRTLGDVMNSINKRDCSAFTCGGHWVDSTAIPQPSSQQPR